MKKKSKCCNADINLCGDFTPKGMKVYERCSKCRKIIKKNN